MYFTFSRNHTSGWSTPARYSPHLAHAWSLRSLKEISIRYVYNTVTKIWNQNSTTWGICSYVKMNSFCYSSYSACAGKILVELNVLFQQPLAIKTWHTWLFHQHLRKTVSPLITVVLCDFYTPQITVKRYSLQDLLSIL